MAAAQRRRPTARRPCRITGFSIDTRSLQPGDVFVALQDARDGHDFVAAAFKAGAAAALVATRLSRAAPATARCCASTIRCDGAGSIGRAARAAQRCAHRRRHRQRRQDRHQGDAAHCACRARRPTHAAEKSYNNHWGVPLTLARMPADARYGVFEIGMNHAGEITPLTEMVRPHVAIVTTVEPVHLELFAIGRGDRRGQGRDLRRARARRRRRPQSRQPALRAAGERASERRRARSSPSAITTRPTSAPCRSIARCRRAPRSSPAHRRRSASPTASAHRASTIAQNSLAVLAALDALGADVETAACRRWRAMSRARRAAARARVLDVAGRLTSCSSTRATTPIPPRCARRLPPWRPCRATAFPRRIAVLGDMLELGESVGRAARGAQGSG